MEPDGQKEATDDTQSIVGTEVQMDQQPASNSGDSEARSSGKRAPRGRRIAITLAIGAAVVAIAQFVAPDTDHQFANMASVVAAAVTLIVVTYQLHRIAKQNGAKWLVPVLAMGILGMLNVLFEFDGFSGEMLPQLRFRFAQKAPPIRSLEPSGQSLAVDLEPDSSAQRSKAIALTDSLGFLGSDRNAVVPEREFRIPETSEDVEILWNQGVGEGWSSFAVQADRVITLEQRDDEECITCYRLMDGEPIWIVTYAARHTHPLGGVGPRSTPTIDGELVYAQGATGMVSCINIETGETVWSADLLDLAGWSQEESEAAISWGRAGSPLLVDGLCVVPFGGPANNEGTGRSLIAFDAASGEVQWTSGAAQISYASPGLLTLAGEPQIVSVNEASITGHRIEDGEVLWEFQWIGQSNSAANCAMVIPVGENRFVIGKGYGGGSALVEVTENGGEFAASAVWESNRVLKTKFTHACIDSEIAYAIGNGSLEAVEIESGDRLWTQPRRSRLGQGQALLVDDVIIGQAESGEVVFAAADPDEYRELLRVPAMDSKTWNVPAVAGRHLLVRNDREAFCFLLPARETDLD